MSQIDQAFIRAYAADDGDAAATEAFRLPSAAPVAESGGIAASHVQLYPATQGGQPVAAHASVAEPIPSPHFQVPGVSEAHADTATMQRAMFEPATEQATLSTSSERRPLSTFSAPAPAPSHVFEPVFEVDAFRWPSIADELLSSHSDLLTPVVEQLLSASEEGRTLIGISGARSGVGCSMVQMCLARLLVDAGKSVAMVDSNFATPHLAKSLGLEFETGWEDVLTGKIPLAECVVRSNQDRMVLVPLSGCQETPVELLSSIQTSVIAGVLRYHYDVVLYDLGAAGSETQLAIAEQIVEQCRLDGSIIVADTDSGHAESDQQIDALLNVLGATCLGVIGNFTAT